MPATPSPIRSRIGLALPALAALGVPLLLAEALGAATPRAQGGAQVFQGFDNSSGEDLTAGRRDERALWGRNSSLTATSHFPGDGGPGGDFDWTIPFGQTFVLDTTFALITNEAQTATETVLNGQVNVRNLTVLGTLRLVGPNGCRIAATGDVLVEGQILARGTNHIGVNTFNTGGPSPGAAGNAGGGRGGTGSILSTQSTPQGESGTGAFNAAGGGGGGGESGYSGVASADFRRGAGGGGGRFGPDMRVAATGCPDQVRIGLDVEQGGPGSPNASGALSGLGIPPHPGLPGSGPFADGDPTNDFWGRMRTAGGATIVGELPRPWAGAGGGGGGDSCQTATFPTTPYTPVSDEIGSGGGGGGGSLVIQALGDIVLGTTARLDVSGGTGGGGENTNGINRVGGGGGGGSGGHLVLQAGRTIDLRALPNPGTGNGTVLALGGQGGEGMNGFGGAGPGGVPTTPAQDSVNLVTPFDPTCQPPNPVVIGSGGDGGPGLVQLHVRDLASILPPTLPGATISNTIRPAPVGAVNVDDPSTWNRLVPPYGADSFSRSQWIDLGVTGPSPWPTFAGTDANGFVLTTGTGADARVLPAPPIVQETLRTGTSLPRVDADGRTLLVDPVSFVQDVWWSEPATLADSMLEFGSAASGARFNVASAAYSAGLVRLTVTAAGTPLAGLAPGIPVVVRPRFFRVATDGVRDSLPTSASIRITFQGAPDDGNGSPDTALAGPWTPDAGALHAVPGLRHVRFQVDFDLTADGSDLTADSPRPSLEYLRIPYLR